MSTLRVNNLTNAGGTGPTYAPGHIIQVVNGTYSTPVSTTSTSFIDSGLSLSITPKSANSKIFITAVSIIEDRRVGNSANITVQLLRNSTPILVDTQMSSYIVANNSTDTYNGQRIPINYLDSPSSTSAVTYKVQFRSYYGETITAQIGNLTSTITLMEVAA